MTLSIAIAVVLSIALVVQVRDYRAWRRESRDDSRSRLLCMRVGCGHTFLDHTPECKHCLCQETSYKWVDD